MSNPEAKHHQPDKKQEKESGLKEGPRKEREELMAKVEQERTEKLKEAVISDYNKGLEKMRERKFMEALSYLEPIVDRKEAIERLGIKVDKEVVQQTLVCANAITEIWMRSGAKILKEKKGGDEEERKEDVKEQREKVKKALPFLTASLESGRTAIKLGSRFSEKGRLEMTLEQLTLVDNLLAEKGGLNEFLLNPQHLKEEEREVLANLFKNKAISLAQALPERSDSVWAMLLAGSNPKKEGMLKEKNLGIRKKERVLLGLESYDPVHLLKQLAEYLEKSDYMLGKEAADNAMELNGLLHQYRERGFYPPDYPEQGKGPVTKKYLKPYLDFKENFREKIRTLKKDLAFTLEESDGKDFELNEFYLLLEPVIQSEEALLKVVDIAKPEPEKEDDYPVLEKFEEKEMSTAEKKDAMDPKAESAAALSAISLFIKAIQMNPKDKEAYEALFDFLDKVKFGNGPRKAYERQLKKYGEKTYEKLPDLIEKSIRATSQITRLSRIRVPSESAPYRFNPFISEQTRSLMKTDRIADITDYPMLGTDKKLWEKNQEFKEKTLKKIPIVGGLMKAMEDPEIINKLKRHPLVEWTKWLDV